MHPQKPIITSFRPWKAHQVSNSSDDLIAALYDQLTPQPVWLRDLPVSFELAPMRLQSELYKRRPGLIICCGMAEGRSHLCLEQQATRQINNQQSVLRTSLNLPALLINTRLSKISHDAGTYVCNDLYYSVLSCVEQARFETAVLFIHIPVLSSKNKKILIADFLQIYTSLTLQHTADH